ncbi:MAG: NAD(P)/FAD-dependent oxidoreductase [Polyangiaceae bacterium]
MESVDTIVIGAGVVGLACARALAAEGREILIVEAERAFGTGASARNSEVIHAGLHYPAGSLRARCCVRGKHLLYAFCEERGVAHRRTGKLVVACSEDEVPRLSALRAQAAANGVTDLSLLDREAARALEPDLACEAALLSPSTGILDSHGLMRALLIEAESNGALLSLRSPVFAGRVTSRGIELDIGGASPVTMRARSVVNAAGLHACDVARSIEGLPASAAPIPRYAKGAYFSLRGRAPFRHLIYPVPGEGGHLGVHLTLDLAGQARFGPTFRWVDQIEYSLSLEDAVGFEEAVRRYWPALPDDALTPAYAGIRPKISAPGEPAADFRIDGPSIHGIPGLVNLFGIESPGLTACLSIAEEVASLLRS